MISKHHYYEVVERFIKSCESLGDRVVAVLLFGSVARGEIVPAKSDVMDAAVILDDLVFVNKAEFLSVLDVLVRACEDLKASGLPFHPFQFYSLTEFREKSWRTTIWKSDRWSRVLIGTDIRATVRSSNGVLANAGFFGSRRFFHRLYEAAESEKNDENGFARDAIEWFVKAIFTEAALVCDCETSYPQSIEVLHNRFPELDRSSTDRVLALRNDDAPIDSVREALELALAITERIDTLLIRYLHDTNRWDELLASLW